MHDSSLRGSPPLVVRFGAMGDMVLLTVLIRVLHARFAQPVDIVASGSWTEPLLAGQPGVGSLFVIGSRRRPYWLSGEQRQLVRRLRARPAGPVWLCESDEPKPLWLLERAGYTRDCVCRATDFSRRAGEHFADRWLRFGACTPRAFEACVAPTATAVAPQSHLVVPSAAREELDRWLRTRGLADRPLIMVQAGNKRTMRPGSRRRASNTKYWPEERWSAVLRGLRALHSQHALLMLGVPREARLNAQIMREAAVGDVYNIAHELPIPRLLALAERAAGLVSVDSGPAHAAAAVGCPVVVLFGKADVALYSPRGPGAIVRCLSGSVDGEASIMGISPEQVLAAWRDVMRERET